MSKKKIKVITSLVGDKSHELAVNKILEQIEIVDVQHNITHGYGSEPRFMRKAEIITIITYKGELKC